MRYSAIATCALLGMTALPTFAQVPPGTDPVTGARPGNIVGTGNSLPKSTNASNIGPADTRTSIAPNLPSPEVGDNATSMDYLRVARESLMGGRTGLAQQSLEMAETRILDRSVPQSQTDFSSDDKRVQQIAEARHALGTGDRARALQIIDAVLTP